MKASLKCISCGLLLVMAFAESNLQILEKNDALVWMQVIHLIGEPDFRDVSLRWEYDRQPQDVSAPIGLETPLYGFQVHYCEMQAWGPHRCRTKVIDKFNDGRNKMTSTSRRSRNSHAFTARISGLRMATTYSFEVRPVELSPKDLADAESIGKSIIVPTKGFSARATQCLPHASEVEVSTGPYFGGRIAVEAVSGDEGAGGEHCAVSGNPASAQDSYTLRIDHEECGSDVNDTTVATYLIVQENLPILTHSTRRFLVLCTYKPETLTVRAGINLPSSQGSADLELYKPHHGSVEPFENQEMDYNEVQPARLEADMTIEEENVAGQIALVVFLVTAVFVSVAALLWKLLPRHSFRSRLAESRIFARTDHKYQDNISEAGSIYSITLSDRDENVVTMRAQIESDNISEA